MFQLAAERDNQNRLCITNSNEIEINYISGLFDSTATINTTSNGVEDGSNVLSTKIDSKEIVISFFIKGNVEKNRLLLKKCFVPKENVKLYYKSEYFDVYIDTIVKLVEFDPFSNPVTCQIILTAPNPYFHSIKDNINNMTSVEKKFSFPFSIEKEKYVPFSEINIITEKVILNNGTAKCGMTIELRALGKVSNIKIFNRDTRDYFGLNFNMEEGDIIRINTNFGKKSVTLLRNGIETNIFNYILDNIDWLSLSPGENVFTYESSNNALLQIKFISNDLYEGV